MLAKSRKMFNCVTFYMSSKKNCQFPLFWQILLSDEIQDGSHIGCRNGPAAPQHIIYTASCRAHHRLSTKGEIYYKLESFMFVGNCTLRKQQLHNNAVNVFFIFPSSLQL